MGTPLNVAPQLLYNGSFNQVPIYAADGPSIIERGYTDEGTIRPSRLTMRVNDAAAPSLNPSRPASLLYGITGRAMPAAFSTQSSVRAWMETASLTPDQDQAYNEASQATASPRGKRWLDVEAFGPLYRIGQWSDTVQSPMTRSYLQYGRLIGFWPGEDATLSTRVGLGRSVANVTFADTDAPPGAAASFVGQASTSVVLSPTIASTTAGFKIFFSMKMGATPPVSALPVMQWRANNLLWSLEPDSGGIHLKAYASGVLAHDFYSGYVISPAELVSWAAFRADCYQSGGNVVCDFAWYSPTWPTVVIAGFSQTFAGTIDRLTSIRITGNASVNGTRYTEVGAMTTIVDDVLSSANVNQFQGYAGETTTTRYTRLMTEAGSPFLVTGTSVTAMGAQKPGKLMDLIKECAATEDGLVFDKKDTLTTVFRTRRSRMNQAVAMTLDAAVDIVPPFTERVDNVGVANVVTLTNRDGYTSTVTQTTGPMAATAYPTGIGQFKGGAYPDVAVNLANPATDMPAMLAWYLARGTVPGPRWPTVTIEVGLRSPGLQAAAKLIEIGDRIQVTNRMADPIDLHVIGIREEIDVMKWTFTFTCIPGLIFDTGAEDDTTHRQQTYNNTIITAPVPATTGTSMVVGSPDPDDVWSTTSLPYPIIVAGEKMTVTAATAPTLVSGTWRQTLTVTRSVNGVVKTQVAGTFVYVFAPYREAW